MYKIFFQGVNSDDHSELNVSDGAADGTLEIGANNGVGAAGGGAYSLAPIDITVFGSEILFENESISPDWGLWLSNGTVTGTFEIGGLSNQQVANAPASGLSPENITTFGTDALFTSNDKNTDQDMLWVTNGTTTGTLEIGGLGNQGIAGKYFGGWNPYNLIAVDDKVFFIANDANDFEGLWVSDGTTAGTFEIGGLNNAEIVNANVNLFEVENTISVGGKLLFQARDSSNESGLWASDGTAAGTVELSTNFYIDTESYYGNNVILYGGKGLDWGLWLSDGTASTTIRIGGVNNAGIAGMGESPEITNFEALGSDMFFEAKDTDNAWGIWRTDGTTAGTIEISGLGDVNVGGQLAMQPIQGAAASIGGKVLFTAEDRSGSYGLWVTDGTVAGTFEIGGLNNAGIDDAYAGGLDPTAFASSGGITYFDAENSSGNTVLWASNGTVAGTYEVAPGANLAIQYTGATSAVIVDTPIPVIVINAPVSKQAATTSTGTVASISGTIALAAGDQPVSGGKVTLWVDGKQVGSASVTWSGDNGTWTATKFAIGSTTSAYEVTAQYTDAAGSLGTSAPVAYYELSPTTVAHYLANQATLDALGIPLVIKDTAANIAASLDKLNTDLAIAEIIVSPSGVLILTVEQATDDPTALGILSGQFTLALADDAANLLGANSTTLGRATSVTLTGTDNSVIAARAETLAGLKGFKLGSGATHRGDVDDFRQCGRSSQRRQCGGREAGDQRHADGNEQLGERGQRRNPRWLEWLHAPRRGDAEHRRQCCRSSWRQLGCFRASDQRDFERLQQRNGGECRSARRLECLQARRWRDAEYFRQRGRSAQS